MSFLEHSDSGSNWAIRVKSFRFEDHLRPEGTWLPITETFFPDLTMTAHLRRESAKELALERIGILISNALKFASTNEILANEQAQLARKIAMRSRVRMPYVARQLYCKKCKKFIIPGKGSRVRVGRTNTKCIRITCTMCRHTYRKILYKL